MPKAREKSSIQTIFNFCAKKSDRKSPTGCRGETAKSNKSHHFSANESPVTSERKPKATLSFSRSRWVSFVGKQRNKRRRLRHPGASFQRQKQLLFQALSPDFRGESSAGDLSAKVWKFMHSLYPFRWEQLIPPYALRLHPRTSFLSLFHPSAHLSIFSCLTYFMISSSFLPLPPLSSEIFHPSSALQILMLTKIWLMML